MPRRRVRSYPTYLEARIDLLGTPEHVLARAQVENGRFPDTDRQCRECGAVLSRYNVSGACWRHNLGGWK